MIASLAIRVFGDQPRGFLRRVFGRRRFFVDDLDEACFVDGVCPVCAAKPTMRFEGDPVRLVVYVWHHSGCPAHVDREPEAA